MSHLDVARHFGGGLLGLRQGAAGDEHAVTVGGECRGGRLANTAVASSDDDSHGAYLTSSQPSVWR